MTERDESRTPTTEDIREDYAWYKHADGVDEAEAAQQFDRWLTAHDEAIRAEERERCARIVERMVYDGGHRIAARIREQGRGR